MTRTRLEITCIITQHTTHGWSNRVILSVNNTTPVILFPPVRSPRPSSAHDRPTRLPPLCRFYGHSLTRSCQLVRQIPLTFPSPPSCLSAPSLFTSSLPFHPILFPSDFNIFPLPLPSPITHWTVYSSFLIYLFISGRSSRPTYS